MGIVRGVLESPVWCFIFGHRYNSGTLFWYKGHIARICPRCTKRHPEDIAFIDGLNYAGEFDVSFETHP
jgi:hypothetical protein